MKKRHALKGFKRHQLFIFVCSCWLAWWCSSFVGLDNKCCSVFFYFLVNWLLNIPDILLLKMKREYTRFLQFKHSLLFVSCLLYSIELIKISWVCCIWCMWGFFFLWHSLLRIYLLAKFECFQYIVLLSLFYLKCSFTPTYSLPVLFVTVH